ncbi:MAG: hypothetical protein JNM90_10030 [Burkholderiales bacterium]|nr:hypothetical protein [Burkholderiales bacterium]
MIVVTGAAGFSGQGVIRALKRAGQPVRAPTGNAQYRDGLMRLPAPARQAVL